MVLARITGFQALGVFFDLAFFAWALYALSEDQSPLVILFACFTTFFLYVDFQYIRTGKKVTFGNI